jgi:hypothetical protein
MAACKTQGVKKKPFKLILEKTTVWTGEGLRLSKNFPSPKDVTKTDCL